MATTVRGVQPAANTVAKKRPVEGLRFDWTFAILSCWTVGGEFLDGWAHAHGKVDNTFFTIWHANLYSGVLALTTLLLLTLFRNHRAGYSWRSALPGGYNLSLIGAGLFLLAGVADLGWHTLFGFEVNIESLVSPSHLGLAFAGVLLVSGPLRAAWLRLEPGVQPARKLLPALVSLTMLLAIFTFFTEFASPFVDVLAISPSGSNSSSTESAEIYTMQPDGRGQTRLTYDPAHHDYVYPTFSPDGKQIVFNAGWASKDNKQDIYIMNTDGSNPVRLTHDQGVNYLPGFSPDGKHIAFISLRDGNGEIYVMNADGSNQIRLTNNSVWDGTAVWSPDSTRLAFQSERDGKYDIYRMNADGSNQTRLTKGPGDNYNPAWSRDGSKIAFVSNRDDQREIYLVNADGTGEVRLTNSAAFKRYPEWSPDGRWVLFVSSKGDVADIYAVNVDGSGLTNLTRNAAPLDILRIAYAPDGKSIMYSPMLGYGGGNGSALELGRELGVASVILQALIWMGFVLLVLRRWALPFGTLTFIFTVNCALLSVLNDQYRLIPAALLAGLIADLLLWKLQPYDYRVNELRVFAFLAPVVLYGLYFLDLFMNDNIGWSVPLWSGAIIGAGIFSLLLTYLLVAPKSVKLEATAKDKGFS